MKKKNIGILGGTGMVGRRLAGLLIGHPWFHLRSIIGSGSMGENYSDVWMRKEAAVQVHYGVDFWKPLPCPSELQNYTVTPFEDATGEDPIDFFFSAISAEGAPIEQRLLDENYTVFSNSPYGRFDAANPLVVPEVNGAGIRTSKFIKNPNCVTSGAALILDALQALDITSVAIVTFQSLSGRGDAKYQSDLVRGNVYPLHKSSENTEDYIRDEIRKIGKKSYPISVSCNRVFVQEGHFVDIKLTTRTKASRLDVERLLSEYDPLVGVSLPSKPSKPIVVLTGPGRPSPTADSYHGRGFTVAVGNIATEDEVFDIRMQYVVNNLIRGAAGNALLSAEHWYLTNELTR